MNPHTLSDGLTSKKHLLGTAKNLSNARVLIIGDVMLDAYLTGDADRISPEAPVPVVRIEKESHLVGGAGNVARNICSLGGTASLVGIRGNDASGKELESCLKKEAIQSSLMVIPSRPTTVKTRILARQQQVLRFDREDPGPLGQEQTQEILRLVEEALPASDAIVLSDYGKGIVTAGLIQGLSALLKQQDRRLPLLVDPKPVNFSLYQGVTLLTPNAKETSESVNMPVKTPDEIVVAGRAIMRRLGSRHLLTTLGSRGMAVFEDADRVWHIPTFARQVFDVTGAGDTVIATLAMGLALQLPLVEASLLANYAAGIVVGQVGAATATPEQLASAIESLPTPEINRWA